MKVYREMLSHLRLREFSAVMYPVDLSFGSVAGSHTLVAPKDSVVAFSEVDGERDALVGSTVDNNLVLW